MSSRHTVAIHMANPQRADSLARELRDDRIEAKTVQNTDELHQVVNRQRIDAVILEQNLPGFLTGLEIVERFQHQLLDPVTILLADRTPDLERKAREQRVGQILDPSDSVTAIAEAVQSSLAAASLSGVQIPYEARQLVSQCNGLQPLPQLVVRLANYLNDSRTSLSQVAHDIAADPNVTARLLRITNSAANGLREKVSRVFDAVNLLGMKRTIAVILSETLQANQSTLMNSLSKDLRDWYQLRTVLTASTASAFARQLNRDTAETAYVLGLLQNIGISVMASSLGTPYFQVMERCRSIAHLELIKTETHDFGMTHADVSAALLQKWELPANMIRLIFSHHDNGSNRLSEVELQLLHAMQIGEAFANLRDVHSPQRYQRLTQLLKPFGGMESQTCRSGFAQAIAKTKEFGDLFNVAVPPAGDLNQIVANLYRRVSVETASAESTSSPLPEAPIDTPRMEEKTALVDDFEESPEETNETPILLVVDDDELIFKMIGLFMKGEPWTLRFASTPKAALNEAGAATIILCDVHLVGEDGNEVSGIELVHQIHEQGMDTPMIMMSGDRTRSTVTAAIQSGICDFLAKPFDKAKLLEKLRKHSPLYQS